MLHCVTSRSVHSHISRHILYKITKSKNPSVSGCNFVRAARRKLVLVRTDISPDTFRPLDWYQSNTFTNIFSKCFVVFWTDISPNLKVSSCCMFPKVARNKAYCGHAYIKDFKWEKIQVHRCTNPRDKKNIFLQLALMQTKMVFLNSPRFFMYTHQVSPLDYIHHHWILFRKHS